MYTFKTEQEKLGQVYLDLHIIEPPALQEDNLAKKKRETDKGIC